MGDIKLVAFDLDGTLFNDDKQVTEENRAALFEAAEKGIQLVPATGRFCGAMPECFRELPFRYYIYINGAEIYDSWEDRVISKVEVDWQRSIEIFSMMDEMPIIYDCYMGNKGYMSQAFRPLVDEFACNEHYRYIMYDLRTPVPELKAFLAEKKQGVQKLQAYFRPEQYPLRDELLRNWKLPGISITSSIPNNLELNHEMATKGHALRRLAAHLGLDMSQTMACGDGSNDLTMIEAAGIGVAMERSWGPLKEAADYITADCNDSGVAKAIRKFCF